MIVHTEDASYLVEEQPSLDLFEPRRLFLITMIELRKHHPHTPGRVRAHEVVGDAVLVETVLLKVGSRMELAGVRHHTHNGPLPDGGCLLCDAPWAVASGTSITPVVSIEP